MITLSKLAACVQPSATLAAGAKARQLRAAGVNVFDFSLGEPDLPTPEHICKAAAEAMQAGHTHYTPVAGVPELRQAIARWYERFHGYKVAPEQVIVSNGAKHSLHNALAATCGPGDEVIIPTPYWVSYSDLVRMTGATPVLVHTTLEIGFKMSPAQLRGRAHAADEAGHAQLAVQPDRHRLHARRTGSARRRGPRDKRRHSQRRNLRATLLRRRQADLLRDAAAGTGRADDHRSAARARATP